MSAFDEGMTAYQEGEDREDCEYPEDSDEYEEWQEGYTMMDMGNQPTLHGMFTV